MLALKDNQPTLHRAVGDHLLGRWEVEFAGDEVGRRQTQETGHGRRESRTYIQLEAPESLPGFRSWRGLKSIGVVISETRREGRTADEVRYYISSLPVEADAATFAHAVRSHWGVENGLPLDPRCDVPRGRVAHPRGAIAREHGLAESLLPVPAETAPRATERRDETPLLRMERRLPHASR